MRIPIYSFAIAVIGGVGVFRGAFLLRLLWGNDVLGGIFFPRIWQWH